MLYEEVPDFAERLAAAAREADATFIVLGARSRSRCVTETS
jgi:hypothetical protein